MSTSVTGKPIPSGVPPQPSPGKTALVYLGLSIFCVVFTNVYALFGHGVRSAAMDCMFLYPLAGGALPFFVISRAFPFFLKRCFSRPACNLYNSGLAALTTGSLLRGIVEIAGTGSEWIAGFFIVGALFICTGIVLVIPRRL